MNFIDTVKGFFKGPKVDPVAVAARDAFNAASNAYDTDFHAIEAYTNRANHRYAILGARRELYKAPLDDPYAADAYDKTVAAYTDSADFDPYTDAYLEAHTAAIDTLSAAFDNLTAAFAALKPADNLYAAASTLYKATSDTYTFAASAYSRAARCALGTALEDNLRAAKDDFQATLLEDRASNPAEANPVAAKAKAGTFKAKAVENATKAKLLEQKARVAKTKAEAFLAKAKSAEAKAEEALERHQ